MSFSRSYYTNSIEGFLKEDINSIFGQLARSHQHDLEDLQKNSWTKQIIFLKKALKNFSGNICFEFAIPRMGKRVDNIIIIDDKIFVVEFKVGDDEYSKYAQDQTIDYCLDLLNFHEGSHDKILIPTLVATNAPDFNNAIGQAFSLESCLLCNYTTFESNIISSLDFIPQSTKIDFTSWEDSIYKPTPTIIEAAQALYKGHNVKEISRSDSGAINLSRTANAINRIIEHCKSNNRKAICFLTGVPGAGKTLAGLNIANERMKADESEHSVFLSGNGPLVDVLREALARDSVLTAKESGKRLSKSAAERKAKTFIQNIHHFRDDNLKTENPPIEKVVVFDEAQRAWQMEQVSKFMKTKKGVEDFNMSEPEYLIGVMNRHSGWCTIICLIGGGQEINVGEAGVSEWVKALKEKFTNWDIHYSDKIISDRDTYLDDQDLSEWISQKGQVENDLHLSVSVRSFRSEKISQLVEYVVLGDSKSAFSLYNSLKLIYPIFLTRNLATAKQWLKFKAKGTERVGIVASSGGRRLRSDGIDVKNEISPADWFLNGQDDVRSSYYLEDVATEFDIQGLEIDYTCVAWDINFYFKDKWCFQNFRGTEWQNINQDSIKSYLLNSYRVLLTRARQGMVIYVPTVDGSDRTRPAELYDSTFAILKNCGFDTI